MFFKPVLAVFLFVGLAKGLPNTPYRKGWKGAAADPSYPAHPYVVGGVPVEGREFPAQISLRIGDFHNCGGSILNSDWIMTAAHCSQYSPSDLNVVTGSNLLDAGGTVHKVTEIRVHEGYDETDSWRNDVAVMKVSPPILLGNGTEVVTLQDAGAPTAPGSTATVVGWGRISAGGPIPNELLKADLPIVSHDECAKTYEGQETIHDTQICAGGDGEKDACNGDSGGPLFVEKKQVGIVSWGRPCANKGYPTVYTEVADYIDWINEHIKG